MSNTAISPAAMHAVLRQLPLMSGRIVDDTRHEKVLSYMRLFLASPGAIARLGEWEVVRVLGDCLRQSSDHRVSAVAVRFLGDCIAVPEAGRAVWRCVADEQPDGAILRWIVENADSQHALLRFSCLYFVRMAAVGGYAEEEEEEEEEGGTLLERLDYRRYVMRRLLDSGSYFVVEEACSLLGVLVYRHGRLDPVLCELVRALVDRPFAQQSTGRKLAVLSAVSALYCGTAGRRPVHCLGLRVLPLDRLALYLVDSDRLIRDRALDVLENTLRLTGDPGCGPAVGRVLAALAGGHADGAGVGTRVRAVTALRIMAAVVKEVPSNSRLVGADPIRGSPSVFTGIAISLLCIAHGLETEASAKPQSPDDELQLFLCSLIDPSASSSRPGATADSAAAAAAAGGGSAQGIRNAVLIEAARLVREHCRTVFDSDTVLVLSRLLEHKRVQANAQLLQLVLDAAVGALRLARHSADLGIAHLLELPAIISNFAIRAPGLKTLFELAHEVVESKDSYDGGLFGRFCVALFRSVRARLVDVEWEARDTALEFVSAVVRGQGWVGAQCLVCPFEGDARDSLIVDAVRALDDPEEYVRASGAQVLAAIVDKARDDHDAVWTIVGHARLGRDGLASLLNDSEAFVKRAALDLVCTIGRAVALSSSSTHYDGSCEWLHCLSYPRLYQIADDPDFEVRVRCASLLALLLDCWLLRVDDLDSDAGVLEGLQPGTLLIDMCGDSSRYVRRVCLDRLSDMKQGLDSHFSKHPNGEEEEEAEAAVDEDSSTSNSSCVSKRRQTAGRDRKAVFYQKLCAIDFARLKDSLTAEHLYQEALDTQVERELMDESEAPNEGNNILDCY
ncbi:hypothetical protein GGH99_000595 [Coemansia sp. RSA 1285]|nr:hypothetical protein EV177_001124 [Coemansia sp. RSA 1804]KAJ2694602.1 hypothetical protein GGH99_000595 [Coemansia sp. RSA 1285]